MNSFDMLANDDQLQKTVLNLKKHNINAIVVDNKSNAKKNVLELIPQGVSVMNGASRTLEQIGFIEYLKSGDHGWNNYHETIVTEKDPKKQSVLRKHATLSDFYLGSVHAVTENGELLIASNTGSQLPHIVFSSNNLIFVVGTQKIVANLTEAFDRLEKYIVPLENENMQQKYGINTQINKIVIVKGENPMMGRKVTIIFVKEKLGF